GVVVDIVITPVEPIERADDVGLFSGVELVRATEAEHLAIPAQCLVEVLGHNDKVAEPLNVRRASLDPEKLALAAVFVLARIDRGTLDRDRIQHLHAVDNFDLVSIGIGHADALATARLVDVLDRRRAVDAGYSFEVRHAGGVDG